MTAHRAFRSPETLIAVGVAAAAITGLRRGTSVLVWVPVGLVGTAAFLFGTSVAIGFASGAALGGPRRRTLLLLLALFLKSAPLVALAFAARGASAAAREGLTIGGSLVYFWLVGWGLTPTSPRPT